MKLVVAVVKEGKAPGMLCRPHAVSIDNNNRIIVTEGELFGEEAASGTHARISVFSDKGEFLTSFTHDLIYPYGLAISRGLHVRDRCMVYSQSSNSR